jgi:hypothetical protein
MSKKSNITQNVLSAVAVKTSDPFMPGGKQFYILTARVSLAAMKEVKEHMRKGKNQN